MSSTGTENKPTGADALAAALNGIGSKLDALTERITKAEQTSAEALEGARKIAADRVEAAKEAGNKDAENAAIKELQAKLEQRDAELKAEREQYEALRLASGHRKSSYDLDGLKERIEAGAGIVKAETKAFWNHGLHQKAARMGKSFGELSFADILMKGAMEPVLRTHRTIDGTTVNVPSFGAMTAGSKDEALSEAQDASDVVFLWMLRKQARGEVYYSIKECPWYERFATAMAVLGKAMTSTTITNWVPTGFSARLWERFEMSRNLINFVNFYQMSQNPENLPTVGAYLTPAKVTQSTSDPEAISTGIGTSNVDDLKTTLELWELAFRVVVNFGAEEDSVPALVPVIMQELASAKSIWLEQFILNADSNTFHIDTDITPTGTDIRARTADGLRPTAVRHSNPVWTTDLSSTHTGEGITGMLGSMGKYGAVPSDVVFVCGPQERASLLVLKNAGNYPLVIGAANSQLTAGDYSNGNIMSLLGSPLVVSEAMREGLGSGGHVDGTSTAYRTLLAFNRRGFVLAARNLQGRTVTGVAIHSAQNQILQYERWEFEDAIPTSSLASTDATVFVGRKIS